MVSPANRGSWWFFVLLIILVVVVWYGVSAVRTDQCSEDAPRDWVWFPPKWECPQRV
jgi:hypothetical protein